MKAFKDLQAGDTIFYYDHCQMKPRTIVKIETKYKDKNTYILIYLTYEEFTYYNAYGWTWNKNIGYV